MRSPVCGDGCDRRFAVMNAMAKCRGTASKDYGEDENVCIAVPRPDGNGNAECDRRFAVMSAIGRLR